MVSKAELAGKKTIFTVIILILTLFLVNQPAYSNVIPNSREKNVLLLNSYHVGFKWTNDITDAFLSEMKYAGYDYTVFVEFMKWKRNPTQENLDMIYTTLKYRYQNEKLDVVAVTDDIAFEFALKHRNEIFPSAHIVFAGINEKSLNQIGEGHDNFTGIVESADINVVIETLFKANPELEKVYLLYDLTESGVSTGATAFAAMAKLQPHIEVEALNNFTHEQVIEKASLIEEQAAIIFLAYTTDIEGVVVEPEIFSRILSQTSKVPIVSIYDFHLGYGIIGGSMVSAKLHGQRLGEITTKLLQGVNIDEIPIIYEPILRTAFDYEQLTRFGIPLDMLPENAEIINKPFSFFETYRVYVLATLGIIILLSVLLAIISISARKLKKTQENLVESHQELSQLHEELVASDEELRSQFDELFLMKESLIESEGKYRLAVDATNDAIVDWDLIKDDFRFSERWIDLTGYSREELENISSWKNIIHKEDIWKFARVFDKDFKTISERDQFHYRIKTKAGEWKWLLLRRTVLFDEKGNPIRLVSAHTDIDQIKKAQDELEHAVYHNHLTGLRNKRALTSILDKLTMSSEKRLFALIFIDIDNFKLINNSIGHSFGDLLLKDIGNRFVEIIPSEAEVFALSGANFVVLQHFKDTAEIDQSIENLRNNFKDTFASNGLLLNISFSMGVALFPQSGKTTDELLRNTDIALHEAKRSGKGQCVYFSQMMKIELMERMIMERCLSEALADNQFSLHYQPQLCLKSGKVTKLEALLRWKNPQLGNVSPNQFISIAEENRLIIPIGEWIIDEVCALLCRLQKHGYEDVVISINISLIQLLQENFVGYVERTLAKYGLSPSRIELEITESMFMESLKLINETLLVLTASGLKVALDDFGKGYSSLSYLSEMPISEIKIDKSFIDGIVDTDNKKTIVDFIVMIGQRLGKEVLAEGVETVEQLDFLMQHGCDKLQGYLFAKPMPESTVLNFLEAKKLLTLEQIVLGFRKTSLEKH